MTPRPYSDKSSLPTDSSNCVTSEIPIQNLPETPSPPTFSATTTPSPTPQEQVTVEPFTSIVITQESNRRPDFGAITPCYPTPGDIMPYDHSLPDFIRQITNQSNLANLHSLSLRVISTLISLHRMSTYLPNLRYLDLEGSILNSLRDIGCSFKNLQILKVGRCQLESLDGTFGLSSLRELYAQKNFINDVSPCSNLPHIRHIDVSGNRIRNISYAGFLSVCVKLKSIVFTENPATEVPDYRKHVRRILPQLETLDGLPLINEDNTDECKEPDVVERYCEASDSSSTSEEVSHFSTVSPRESMNNFSDLEGLLFLERKNKQAKNLANQDLFDVEIQEISPDIRTNLLLHEDFHEGSEKTINQNFGEPSNLTTGLPVCGNLTAALRSRKKALNAKDEKQHWRGFLTKEDGNEKSREEYEIKKPQVEINASGDSFHGELDVYGAADKEFIEENVLTTSEKWRQAFRRFRSNNRGSREEENGSAFTQLLKEKSDLTANQK